MARHLAAPGGAERVPPSPIVPSHARATRPHGRDIEGRSGQDEIPATAGCGRVACRAYEDLVGTPSACVGGHVVLGRETRAVAGAVAAQLGLPAPERGHGSTFGHPPPSSCCRRCAGCGRRAARRGCGRFCGRRKSSANAEKAAVDFMAGTLGLAVDTASPGVVAGVAVDLSKSCDHIPPMLREIADRAGLSAAIAGPMCEVYAFPHQVRAGGLAGQPRGPSRGLAPGCPAATDWMALLMYCWRVDAERGAPGTQARPYVDDLAAQPTGPAAEVVRTTTDLELRVVQLRKTSSCTRINEAESARLYIRTLLRSACVVVRGRRRAGLAGRVCRPGPRLPRDLAAAMMAGTCERAHAAPAVLTIARAAGGPCRVGARTWRTRQRCPRHGGPRPPRSQRRQQGCVRCLGWPPGTNPGPGPPLVCCHSGHSESRKLSGAVTGPRTGESRESVLFVYGTCLRPLGARPCLQTEPGGRRCTSRGGAAALGRCLGGASFGGLARGSRMPNATLSTTWRWRAACQRCGRYVSRVSVWAALLRAACTLRGRRCLPPPAARRRPACRRVPTVRRPHA